MLYKYSSLYCFLFLRTLRDQNSKWQTHRWNKELASQCDNIHKTIRGLSYIPTKLLKYISYVKREKYVRDIAKNLHILASTDRNEKFHIPFYRNMFWWYIFVLFLATQLSKLSYRFFLYVAPRNHRLNMWVLCVLCSAKMVDFVGNSVRFAKAVLDHLLPLPIPILHQESQIYVFL